MGLRRVPGTCVFSCCVFTLLIIYQLLSDSILFALQGEERCVVLEGVTNFSIMRSTSKYLFHYYQHAWVPIYSGVWGVIEKSLAQQMLRYMSLLEGFYAFLYFF